MSAPASFEYEFVDAWARLPAGWSIGDVGGVAVGPDDRVYVFHRGTHPMLVFSREGELIDAWGDGLFTSPHGLDLAWDGHLYCTDDGDHTVRRFDLAGHLTLEIGIAGQASAFLSGQPFNRCTHSALAPDGRLFVSDGYRNACVHCFGADARHLFSFGRSGCGRGEFQVPHNIVCDASGTLYVADRENHRVQLFDGQGHWQASWYELCRPMALALGRGPDRLMYVAEAGPSFNAAFTGLGPRIGIRSLDGESLGQVGDQGFGHAADRFMAPHGLAVDSHGDLYVGEVAHAAWKVVRPGEPVPTGLRTLRKLRRKVAATAGALALAAAAATSTAATSTAATPGTMPVAGGTLSVVLRGDPGTLDCHAVASSTVSMAVSPGYSTLLRLDPAQPGRVVPGVARSWTLSPDGLSYTFKLEPQVSFHDGTPLTAEDVRVTFERIRRPPPGVTSVRAGLFADVKLIRVVDAQTIVFSLVEPNPAMLTLLANPWNCLYSARRLAQDPNYPARHVMGTGPFRLVEYTPGTRLVYEKFPGYFRKGLPYLDRLELTILSNAAVVPALSSGQVEADFYTLGSALQQQVARARGAQTVFNTSPMSTTSFVAFNQRRKELADPRVRRALTLALDRPAAEASLARLVAVKDHWPFYRQGTAYALPREQLSPLPGFGADIQRARDEARALLQAAGAAELKLVLVTPATRDPFEALGVFLADAWRRIGVQVEIRTLDGAGYLAAKGKGEFDALIDWNSPVSAHPTEVLEKYTPGSANNASGAQDAELVALYKSIKQETDAARLHALCLRFQRRVLEQAHVAPLFFATRTVALPANLRGWSAPANFYLGMDHAEIWREPAVRP